MLLRDDGRLVSKTVAETDGAAEMQAYRAGFATEPF